MFAPSRAACTTTRPGRWGTSPGSRSTSPGSTATRSGSAKNAPSATQSNRIGKLIPKFAAPESIDVIAVPSFPGIHTFTYHIHQQL